MKSKLMKLRFGGKGLALMLKEPGFQVPPERFLGSRYLNSLTDKKQNNTKYFF